MYAHALSQVKGKEQFDKEDDMVGPPVIPECFKLPWHETETERMENGVTDDEGENEQRERTEEEKRSAKKARLMRADAPKHGSLCFDRQRENNYYTMFVVSL